MCGDKGVHFRYPGTTEQSLKLSFPVFMSLPVQLRSHDPSCLHTEPPCPPTPQTKLQLQTQLPTFLGLYDGCGGLTKTDGHQGEPILTLPASPKYPAIPWLALRDWDTNSKAFPPHNTMRFWHSLGVLQVNSILTPLTWDNVRSHKLMALSPWDGPFPTPHFTCQSGLSPALLTSRLDQSVLQPPPPPVWLICWIDSQNSENLLLTSSSVYYKRL